MYIIIYTKYPSLVRSYKNIAKRQKSEVRSQISLIYIFPSPTLALLDFSYYFCRQITRTHAYGSDLHKGL